MNDIHQLSILKAMINTYFSDSMHYDETPEGAKKRQKLKKAILELSKGKV